MRQYQNRERVHVYYIVSGETLYVLLPLIYIITYRSVTNITTLFLFFFYLAIIVQNIDYCC